MYETKDFYFSATLLSYGMKLLGSREENRVVYFQIDNSNEELFAKLVTDFINYEATVNLGKFTKSMAVLRKELDKYKLVTR